MSLSEEILEECMKAEAHKPSQIIPIAISVFEKRIDSSKYKLFKDNNIVIPNSEDNTEYQKGYAHGVIDLKKEMLK